MSNNAQNSEHEEEPNKGLNPVVAEGSAVQRPQEGGNESHQFPHASEDEERQNALRRGRLARQMPSLHAPPPHRDPHLVNAAVAALCENVRDYAIFVLNSHGVIVYWGMGAQLVKWWTKEEAEGAHLRLLYPEGGSEDGTAEEHLRQAAEEGEYVGEGQRVRRGGTTFWAHVTLTALLDEQGKLLGFAKVTRDLTMRRAKEAAEAAANEARASRDSAITTTQEAAEAQLRAERTLQRAETAAEFALEQARVTQKYMNEVLAPELAAERAERAALETEIKALEEQRRYNEQQRQQNE